MSISTPPQHPTDCLFEPVQGPQIGQIVAGQDPRERAAIDSGLVGEPVCGNAGTLEELPHRFSNASSSQHMAGGVIDERTRRPLPVLGDELSRLGQTMAGHEGNVPTHGSGDANAPEQDSTIIPGRAVAHGHDGVPAAAGRLAHRVIAEALILGKADDFRWLDRRMRQLRNDGDRSLNRRRVYLTAATAVASYLRFLRPTRATLMCAEEVIGGTRPDLVWKLPSGLVFFDELKTGRHLNIERIRPQALRQLEAGWEEFGFTFVGVRVISSTSRHGNLLFNVDKSHCMLADSWLSVDAMRSTAAEEAC